MPLGTPRPGCRSIRTSPRGGARGCSTPTPCWTPTSWSPCWRPHAGPRRGGTGNRCGSSSGCRGDETFTEITELLKRGNRYAHAAGALIMVCIDEGEDDRTARYAAVDAGAAIAQLTIEAVSRGLVAHPMAGFDADGAREVFGTPAGVRPVAVVAVGSLGDYERRAAGDRRARRPGPPSPTAGRGRVRRQLGTTALVVTRGQLEQASESSASLSTIWVFRAIASKTAGGAGAPGARDRGFEHAPRAASRQTRWRGRRPACCVPASSGAVTLPRTFGKTVRPRLIGRVLGRARNPLGIIEFGLDVLRLGPVEVEQVVHRAAFFGRAAEQTGLRTDRAPRRRSPRFRWRPTTSDRSSPQQL